MSNKRRSKLPVTPNVVEVENDDSSSSSNVKEKEAEGKKEVTRTGEVVGLEE